MKGIICISLFLLLRVASCEDPEFYNILKDSIDTLDSDAYGYIDGMDGWPAIELLPDNPLLIPIKNLNINDKILSTPFIINTIFKLETENSSCLFKIIEKETTKLGICFIQVSQTFKRVYIYSDAFDPIEFLISHELVDRWTKMLFYIEDQRVSLRINCSEERVAELKKVPKEILFSSEAVLSLGHSAIGAAYPFQGAIQEIKIYPNADSDRVNLICSEDATLPESASDGDSIDDDFIDTSRGPAEKGEKGDKGESVNGPMGPQGPPGPVGPQGVKGDNGTCECSASTISEMILKTLSKGPRGDIGPPGKDGAQGLIGPQGLQGPVGPQGSKGDKGDRGDNGTPGIDGSPGSNGEPGAVGKPGPVGPPGPACKEVKGEKGESGSPGSPGKDGDNGQKGDRGEQGPPGPTGAPGNITQLLDSDMNRHDLEAVAKKLKSFCGPEDKHAKSISNVTIIGPQGPKGQKGDRGSKGASGSRGLKGDKGSISKAELQKLKGEKGERGEKGPIGPPGPPSLTSAAERGPPGPPGPRGHPGVSIVGPKGEPGRVSFSSVYEERTGKGLDKNSEEYVYVTETVVFKSTTALFKHTANTPQGTLAFVRQSKTLVLRVHEGWQQVMLGSLFQGDSLRTVPKAEHPTRPQKLRKPKINLNDGFIRLAALNTPFSGNLLNHFNETKFYHSQCQPQAVKAGVMQGPFLPFLAEKDPHNYLRWKVIERHRKYPVVNLKNEILFDSYEDMFDGSGATLADNHPPIYSFSGKNVFIHPEWPIKAVWHGSDLFGYRQPGADCESFQSNSSNVYGVGSPLKFRKLLAQEWFSCDQRLIVLCLDFTAKKKNKRHSRRRSFYRYDVSGKSDLDNVPGS